ncbi:cytochrome c biogenesis protein [Campylobacter corcagiensis]|uniref:Cytochrome c biogenesis protein CcsA n=1 Tax=Campylobacter corcagiensis TaxID=1448857 RepID=A0A7M1LE12_9BACT|nr:cytochrome c biogenesis protein CcsA [Campylobacter corcagiensis]QKF65025.1 cytochrome c synthetase [Campylobacter corcagiensis]QOQ86822.1 cytochrome c biogenesis protein CcsA [Campylobacter corcagiensis]
MDRLIKAFFSMTSMIVMLIIFAIASGLATIIESAYNTAVAWEVVYGAWWFHLIQLLLTLNLIYNLYAYRAVLLKNIPSFIFHFSFILIFLGAAITHFFGVEGSMHIREGSTTNIVSTRETYIQLISKDENGNEIRTDDDRYVATNGQKPFDIKLDTDKGEAVLTFKEFLLNAGIGWVEHDKGRPIVELSFWDDNNKNEIPLTSGHIFPIGDLDIAFNTEPKQSHFMKIYNKDDKFFMKTNQKIAYAKMGSSNLEPFPLNTEVEIDDMTVYRIDNIVNFSFKTLMKSARLGAKKLPHTETGSNAMLATLSYNGETEDVFILQYQMPRQFTVGGKEFFLAWSPRMVQLPFSLELKDFKMDRYPGSNSPSGYSSEVVVKDEENSVNMPYEIYMNNVLDYGGYRFFQSSYDMDELGTILSVNRDPGKVTTYIGYFLMMVGMLLNFFSKNSRFLFLARKIDESSSRKKPSKIVKSKNSVVAILAILVLSSASISQLQAFPGYDSNSTASSSTSSSQTSSNTTPFSAKKFPSYKDAPTIDKAHAQKAKTLVVQGFDGRMEPLDTMARNIMTKIYKKDEFNGMDYMQALLSMSANYEYWIDAPYIRVSEDELKKILGIPLDTKYATYNDFWGVDAGGQSYYKLGRMAEATSRKPPNERGTLDKDIIKVDERFSIFYQTVIMNAMLKIMPKENAENNDWYSPYGVIKNFSGDEAMRARMVLQNYIASIQEAQKSGDWSKADQALDLLKQYQNKVGHEVIPSLNRLKFEVIFNEAQIFQRLVPVYLLAGFALLILVFSRMMSPKLNLSTPVKAVYLINIIAFIAHTIGLGIRWYVSGHAPWSDTYESLVYIAWSLSLSGIIFSRTSAISLSLTSIMAGITLFVAHLSAIDPQITPLQPVLNSYWLTIHVSVITASYGFFGLSALLGAFVLVLFIIKKPGHRSEISKNITEACRINEMSLILGLCLLSAGNFLGGIWANESWGRYWGWDSKETWSLVTILVYAAIVHFKRVPSMNSQYALSVASMWAFSSVLMTYFGVNFYLAGMHSYAGGETIPIPTGLWIYILSMILITVISYFKRHDSNRL